MTIFRIICILISSRCGEFEWYARSYPGSNKGNPNISWEKGGNLNGGVEFELFNTRLNGSVEAFYRKTTDMLAFFLLPQSSGHWGYYSNVGDMTNTGVEIEPWCACPYQRFHMEH